jgi:hypothetical protein
MNRLGSRRNTKALPIDGASPKMIQTRYEKVKVNPINGFL